MVVVGSNQAAVDLLEKSTHSDRPDFLPFRL